MAGKTSESSAMSVTAGMAMHVCRARCRAHWDATLRFAVGVCASNLCGNAMYMSGRIWLMGTAGKQMGKKLQGSFFPVMTVKETTKGLKGHDKMLKLMDTYPQFRFVSCFNPRKDGPTISSCQPPQDSWQTSHVQGPGGVRKTQLLGKNITQRPWDHWDGDVLIADHGSSYFRDHQGGQKSSRNGSTLTCPAPFCSSAELCLWYHVVPVTPPPHTEKGPFGAVFFPSPWRKLMALDSTSAMSIFLSQRSHSTLGSMVGSGGCAVEVIAFCTCGCLRNFDQFAWKESQIWRVFGQLPPPLRCLEQHSHWWWPRVHCRGVALLKLKTSML